MEIGDAPYTGDLDLAAVYTRDDLLARLRTLYIRADKPSLRTLETRTRKDPNPLSKTVAAEMLHGTRFPRKAAMVAFLRACGVPDDAIEPWRRAWEQVAASEEASAQPGTAQAAPAGQTDSTSPQVSSTDQASLLKEISTLRGLLAGVAESAAKSVIPDVEQALQSVQLPDKFADEIAISLKSATSEAALDVIILASIGTLLNEHGEVSIPRLLRDLAHRVPGASPSAISATLEELRQAGTVSWRGDDVMKAGVIRVHP